MQALFGVFYNFTIKNIAFAPARIFCYTHAFLISDKKMVITINNLSQFYEKR